MVILFSDLPTNENTFVALTTPGINVSTITEEQGMKCFTRQDRKNLQRMQRHVIPHAVELHGGTHEIELVQA